MTDFQHVAIIGAGAWGTALANACARAGRIVTLIARDADVAAAMTQTRNAPRLPGVTIDTGVTIIGSIDNVSADVVLVAVPAQAMRAALMPLQDRLPANAVVVSCAKGIERGTLRYTTDIIAECLPHARAGILSGPSFADDVARGLPTAVTLAASDEALAAQLCQALGSAAFRLYHSTDVRGVEIGGAAKNVLAIAAGIVAGKNLGASALAAVTTRGFAELARFGRACDARPETLAGLSGLGDLLLTCSSAQSRNFSFGMSLGRGASAKSVSHNLLVEGAFTAIALLELAEAHQIEMPICQAVTAILENRIAIDDAIAGLLSRPFRSEE